MSKKAIRVEADEAVRLYTNIYMVYMEKTQDSLFPSSEACNATEGGVL